MARMRKAARLLRRPDARDLAQPILFDCDRYWSVDPRAIFGRAAPIELEIGAGRGDFVIERAASMPERDFLAVELASTIAQLMAMRAGRQGLTNLRVLRMDARSLINLMLPDSSLSGCHIYFPDPWPKERHVKHRFFSPIIVRSLRRVLMPDALLYIASDVREYAEVIFAMLADAGFRRIDEIAPGATRTGFARKFIEDGRPIYSGAFRY